MKRSRLHTITLAVLAFAAAGLCAAADGTPTQAPQPPKHHAAARSGGHHKLDHSGRRQIGKASFYARRFAGRKMADGTRMDPAKPVAASKTLPLGTVAKVTNLETGKSTAVTIQDRGPYVPGRIIDLSPSTAKEIGITHKNGVAPVEVAPIAVPAPDGHVIVGEGAKETPR